MPIHDYKCLQCGIEFEYMKIRSEETVECPKCENKEERLLEQQVSTGTSFTLKGPNWAQKGKGGY